MARLPSELPDEHVICYPEELKGDYLPPDDHAFICIEPSAEAPTKSLPKSEETLL